MNVDVSLLPVSITQVDLSQQTIVAVDVLRATSTIVAACERQVERVIPAETLDDALKLAQLFENSVLAGEVDSIKPPAFSFDNTPAGLYLAEEISNQTVILRTSNGTRLLKKLQEQQAQQVVIASFINLHIVAQYLHSLDQDVFICCAGTAEEVSLEDIGFAGALIEALNALRPDRTLSDAAQIAISVWQDAQCDIDTLFSRSSHAQRLIKLGRSDDLDFIAKMRFDCLPVFWGSTGMIKRVTPVLESVSR